MRLLSFTRAYIWFWLAIAGVYFVNINWYGGAGAKFDNWYDITHYTWISVPQSIVLLFPAIVAFGIVRRYGGWGSQLGRALTLLMLGVVSWGVVGNGIFFLAQMSHDGATPDYPWWPDLGYVGLLPLYAFGLYYLSKVVAMERADYLRLAWVPALVIAGTWWLTLPTGGAGPEWVLGSWGSLGDDPTFGPLNAAMASIGYLAMDIVIFSWALVIASRVRRISGSAFGAPVTQIMISGIFLYLADLFFDQRIAAGTYYTGDIATICYTASLYLMTNAVISFGVVERKLAAGLRVAATTPVATGGTTGAPLGGPTPTEIQTPTS